MKPNTKIFLGFGTLITILVWLIVYTYPEAKLHIIACDVGQGDATLLTYRSTQVLVDGGPDKSVLDCLSDNIPFWDRVIELVILTHPEKDHYGGLVYVFENYEVQNMLANSLDSSSQDYQVLQNLVGGGSTKVLNPTSGLSIGIDLIHLDIVWPTTSFLASKNIDYESNILGASTSNTSANEFSVVAVVSLGETSILLTGDVMPPAIDDLVEELRMKGVDDVDYIKIPHHGSKNGLTPELLDQVKPGVAIISVGKDNSYGHPHEQILKMLEERNIKIYRTDEMGEIVFGN